LDSQTPILPIASTKNVTRNSQTKTNTRKRVHWTQTF
jgi:hypothetical protein